MYAVIETGGKQYRVEVGTLLEVERLEVEPGQEITLDRVLLVADGGQASIGRPLVADAVVTAEVLRQDRGDKVISFKYRPKARRRVKKGHRQELTVLRVMDVRLGERSAAAEVRRVQDAERSERERLQEAACLRFGFRMLGHSHRIFGLCSRCVARGRDPGNAPGLLTATPPPVPGRRGPRRARPA